MFLLVIHVVLLPTQYLCFDMQKLYWSYAASPVHILYGRRFILNGIRDSRTIFLILTFSLHFFSRYFCFCRDTFRYPKISISIDIYQQYSNH